MNPSKLLRRAIGIIGLAQIAPIICLFACPHSVPAKYGTEAYAFGLFISICILGGILAIAALTAFIIWAFDL